MVHAIRVHATGGPEVLAWEEIALGAPGPGEVLLRQTAIGLNFLDVYQRSGLYQGTLPFIPGNEGVGIVEAVGEGVTAFRPGDRAGYPAAVGAYAEKRLIKAAQLVHIPAGIDDRTAAALLLKGMTAEYLLHRTFKVEPGHTILLHAAAGAVGSIAAQWAKALGATVIGTVGSDDKRAAAKANGCAHVINYRSEDFVARVKEITGGAGVEVAYDSVGKDTFPGSIECLKPFGMWVLFGQSSGRPPALEMQMLQKGSLFATRPTLHQFLARRDLMDSLAERLFAAVAAGAVSVSIGQEFALRDAAEAHRALEGRRTTGATVLVP